jgi:putative membrane protein
MKTFALILATLFMGALSVSGYSQQQKPASPDDMKAIRDLAEANMAEVEAGKLAAQKAQSDDVKKFAQHMVDDHGKLLQEVQQLAQDKGVGLPKSPNAKHQAEMKKLESASGDQFDRLYAREMVKGHQETLKEVQKIARSAKDPDVKAVAEKALPDIKEHLQMAQSIAGKSGTASQGASGRNSDTSGTGNR